jgi:hypothetical protein
MNKSIHVGNLLRDMVRPGITLVAIVVVVLSSWLGTRPDEAGRARLRRGGIRAEVVAAVPQPQTVAAMMPPSGFSSAIRLGFTVGEQWEPAIAADNFGHVYIFYAQYSGVPGCNDCGDPMVVLQVSQDGGNSWGTPRTIYSTTGGQAADGQWDPQIVVDPVDGRTIYTAWLQNNKSDVVVGKSTDFGQTWSVVTADGINSAADKPILLARGQDVYVAYNHANKMWFSSSHDGGQTFTSASKTTGPLGWPLPAGGAVTSNGHVYFAWGGYEKSGNATGNANLFVTRSTNGGATWSVTNIDTAGAGPACAEDCGWGYLATQMVMATDDADNLYLLWDGSSSAGDPGRVYFSRSTDGGTSWSAKEDVSAAPANINHNFPAIAASGNGDVRISWMDTRQGGPFSQAFWNTYYRRSTNGGLTWSSEIDVSDHTAGFDYIHPQGFNFPYGDYYELDIDHTGQTHIIWGAGQSYYGAGSVWYSRGN